MKTIRVIAVVAIVAMIGFLVLRTTPAEAHEGRDLGQYHVVVGWRVEPALTGVSNGAELFISMKDDPNKKVEGAEKTLKLEVSFGDKTKPVKLRAAFRDPGHYVTDIIPTRPGDYTFHVTGKIGDVAIDEKFTSADGKFSSVEPTSDVLFPDSQQDIAGVQAQIDALKAEVEALKAAKK